MQNDNCISKRFIEDKEFFTQICSMENVELPSNLPDIEQVVSSVVEPEVISIKAINTMKGLSYEGQYLSGKKVVIELKLKEKILYVAENASQSVHIIENVSFQSVYVVIPCLIEGTDPEFLIKHKYLKTDISIEDIFIKQLGKRKIFRNVCLLVKLFLIPTYEVCYSFHKNCMCSDIFIMHENGSNKVQITFNKKSKSKKPLWSPHGRSIAFLSNCEGSNMLYTYCLKTCTSRRITNPNTFKSISSFCWSADGVNLIFSAHTRDSKEIFITDINKFQLNELTRGNGVLKSHNPKCSPDGSKIAFLRSFSGMTNLWVMNNDGMECKKLTSCGGTKCFDWSKDSKSITYISSKDGKPDEVCILDMSDFNSRILVDSSAAVKKRKIQFSPDGNNIAFISSNSGTEDIWVYDLNKDCVKNITNNPCNIKISDFIWNSDSSKIYYSANDLFYFNIYSVYLKNYIKWQLTSTMSSNIEINYRPRIG